MKKPYIILVFTVFSSAISGQSLSEVSVVDNQVSPGNVLELPLRPPKTDGTYFLYDNWKPGEVTLINEQIAKNVPIKYDLFNNWLEIKTDDDIKICPSTFLSSFKIAPNPGEEYTYLNIRQFRSSENDNLDGIFREIARFPNKNIILVARPYTYLKESTYVMAIDMGTRNDKIIKKEKFYVIIDGFYQELPKKKREFYAIFKSHSNDVIDFANKNKVSHKTESGLHRILNFFDQL